MEKRYLMSILLQSINVQILNGGFSASRIKPGKFEYPELNGWMLVDEAKTKCENDIACGGFTFKGSFKTKHVPMEVYFFHVVPSTNIGFGPISVANFDDETKVALKKANSYYLLKFIHYSGQKSNARRRRKSKKDKIDVSILCNLYIN